MKEEDMTTTRHLVDPELVALLDQVSDSVLTAEIVRQSRAMISQAPDLPSGLILLA